MQIKLGFTWIQSVHRNVINNPRSFANDLHHTVHRRRGRVHPGQAQAHHIGRGGDQEGLGPVGRQRGHRIAALQAARLQRLDHLADQRTP